MRHCYAAHGMKTCLKKISRKAMNWEAGVSEQNVDDFALATRYLPAFCFVFPPYRSRGKVQETVGNQRKSSISAG